MAATFTLKSYSQDGARALIENARSELASEKRGANINLEYSTEILNATQPVGFGVTFMLRGVDQVPARRNIEIAKSEVEACLRRGIYEHFKNLDGFFSDLNLTGSEIPES
jgi:hypothetical protein